MVASSLAHFRWFWSFWSSRAYSITFTDVPSRLSHSFLIKSRGLLTCRLFSISNEKNPVASRYVNRMYSSAWSYCESNFCRVFLSMYLIVALKCSLASSVRGLYGDVDFTPSISECVHQSADEVFTINEDLLQNSYPGEWSQ